MTETPLAHWLFLYGTMILYILIGIVGLWLSARSQVDGDKPRGRKTNPPDPAAQDFTLPAN